MSRVATSKQALVDELDTADDSEEDRSAPRFVMDFSLFRAAKQLRLLGYDVVCDGRVNQQQLMLAAIQQKRILVSGGRNVVPQVERHNKDVRRGRELEGGTRRQRQIVGYNSDGESEYGSSEDDDDEEVKVISVKATDPHDKTLHTIMEECHLQWDPKKIFTRCVQCNRLIKEVKDRSVVQQLVHPTVFRVYKCFYQCPTCRKVYWGVDNGVIVNFKALRTIEYLKRYAKPGNIAVGMGHQERAVDEEEMRHLTQMPRHFLSFPRKVKCLIFQFLPDEVLDVVLIAFPMMDELVGVVRRNGSWKFVPEWKMKDQQSS